MGRVEMEVITVREEPDYGPESAFALILGEKHGHRRLKIIIARPEAQAISMELEKFVFRRPLTHDLLVSILHTLEARVLELTIHKLEENTFYAYLLIESPTNTIVEVDCRPSDGVAIALKTKAPIYCEEHLLEIAGIPIESISEETESTEPDILSSASRFKEIPLLSTHFARDIIDMIRQSTQLPSVESLIEHLANLSPDEKREVINLLQKFLNEAIRNENYELAAQLRDLIQRLEKS